MKNKYLLTLLVVLALSCNESRKTQKKSCAGNLCYIDSTGNDNIMVSRTIDYGKGFTGKIDYMDGKFIISHIYFNKKKYAEYIPYNGLEYKGYFYTRHGLKFGYGHLDTLSHETGWWDIYDAKGRLYEKRHTLLVNYDAIVNQVFSYRDGKIDSVQSKFADIKFFKQTKPNLHKASLIYSRRLDRHSYVSLLISSKINDNFTNLNSVKFDTIAFEQKAIMEFTLKIKKGTAKILRGFIVEQYAEKGLDDNYKSKSPATELLVPFEVKYLAE